MAPEGNFFATDACPRSFAGVLFERFKPVAWALRHSRRTTFARSEPASDRPSTDSLSALRSMVRLSSKPADLNVVAQELALDAVLGLQSLDLATHIPGVSHSLPVFCHGCGPLRRTSHRCLSSACHGNRLQIGIVGSGRPPLQSTGAEHWQESSHRRGEATRVSCAFLLIVVLLSVQSGPAGHPTPSTACHPGRRGFTACLCGLVKLHHYLRVSHHSTLSSQTSPKKQK